MTNGRIYLVDEENERLLPMREERYAQEDILQDLISAYPDLIPGDQIDDDRPRRWIGDLQTFRDRCRVFAEGSAK